ncbi:MAG: GTP cyclohydrolase II [Chloroflexota bacterium]
MLKDVDKSSPDLDQNGHNTNPETCIVTRLETTRIPTAVGQFQLHIYENNQDNKEHLALVMGQVNQQDDVVVRLHSECYTGDVLGSQRCDCGEQLQRAMETVARVGAGVIVYLRQEGRGIGLLEKLRAYNLQDLGHDTVDANLLLGHQADARDYTIAARILEDLGIKSVQLLTNNPKKIASLRTLGIPVTTRLPIYGDVNTENEAYIQAKVTRMAHFPQTNNIPQGEQVALMDQVDQRLAQSIDFCSQHGRPYVTITYAQTLDGSIAFQPGQPFSISNDESYKLTHQLRAKHSGILVGINTVLADNPRLSVRLAMGTSPQPIILDSTLRFPLDVTLLQNPNHVPWIITTEQANQDQQMRLESKGARIFRVSSTDNDQVNLSALLALLADLGIDTLMVEGGAQIITSFIKAQLADQLIVTIAPTLAGGLRAMGNLEYQAAAMLPQLKNIHREMLGDDTILRGDFAWQA